MASCCDRIRAAETNLDKARQSLDEYIASGGYDHWGDLAHFAGLAAKEICDGKPFPYAKKEPT